MTHKNVRGEIHPVAQMYAKEHLDGEMDRREFMAPQPWESRLLVHMDLLALRRQ